MLQLFEEVALFSLHHFFVHSVYPYEDNEIFENIMATIYRESSSVLGVSYTFFWIFKKLLKIDVIDIIIFI